MELPRETAEGILFKIQQKTYDNFLEDWLRYDSLPEDDNIIEREKILKKQSEHFLSLYNQLTSIEKNDIRFWISIDDYFSELWSLYTLDYKFEEKETE